MRTGDASRDVPEGTSGLKGITNPGKAIQIAQMWDGRHKTGQAFNDRIGRFVDDLPRRAGGVHPRQLPGRKDASSLLFLLCSLSFRARPTRVTRTSLSRMVNANESKYMMLQC